LSDIPSDLKYTQSHEWVRSLEDGQVEIGVTDYAQNALGDIVFIEIPKVGRHLNAGEPFAVIESVKAASDAYIPVSGTINASNSKLTDQPELLNQEPYGAGWLVRVAVDGSAPASQLLTADEYEKFLADQA